jgi:hypothetical protein
LLHLNLWGNRITNTGVLGLLAGLRENRCLLTLNLSFNRLDDGAVPALGELVTRLRLTEAENRLRRRAVLLQPKEEVRWWVGGLPSHIGGGTRSSDGSQRPVWPAWFFCICFGVLFGFVFWGNRHPGHRRRLGTAGPVFACVVSSAGALTLPM